MGLFNRICDLVSPVVPGLKDHDREREEVESTVADLAHNREDANAKIAAWEERTNKAIRTYKPGLIDSLDEARQRLGHPLNGRQS